LPSCKEPLQSASSEIPPLWPASSEAMLLKRASFKALSLYQASPLSMALVVTLSYGDPTLASECRHRFIALFGLRLGYRSHLQRKEQFLWNFIHT
jgi:hypothetical protein